MAPPSTPALSVDEKGICPYIIIVRKSLEPSKHTPYRKFSLMCLICGKEYFVYKYQIGKSKYCSHKCLGEAKRQKSLINSKANINCECCGNVFKRKSTKQRFCSLQCSAKSICKSGQENSLYIERIALICEHCNSTFLKRPVEITRHPSSGRFCSRKCKDAHMKKEKIKTNCLTCGKEILGFPCHPRSYCSQRCKYITFSRSTSSIEIKLKESLEKAGYTPEWQVELGYYILDLAFSDKKLAIECDGDYWHSLPAAKARDARKNGYLINRGWRVARLWEHEINKNSDICAAFIISLLNQNGLPGIHRLPSQLQCHIS